MERQACPSLCLINLTPLLEVRPTNNTNPFCKGFRTARWRVFYHETGEDRVKGDGVVKFHCVQGAITKLSNIPDRLPHPSKM